MKRHALTIAERWSWSRYLAGLLCAFLVACSRNQGTPEVEVPSDQELWLASACTPASPDFSGWARDQHGALNFAVPPGYTFLKGPPDVIALQGPARRSSLGAHFILAQEARKTFDTYRFRKQARQNICRGSFGGYPAEVVASFDHGRYNFVALFEPAWRGANEQKFLYASITSSRLEEARDLRTVLHSIQLTEIK